MPRFRILGKGYNPHWPQHCVGKFIWRFATGAHMDGKTRTNASWWVPGTQPKHKANWWNRKPRGHRMIWRWGIVLFAILDFAFYQYNPWWFFLVNLAITPFLLHRIAGNMRDHFRRVRRVKAKEPRAPLKVERKEIDTIGAEPDPEIDKVMELPPLTTNGKPPLTVTPGKRGARIIRDPRFDNLNPGPSSEAN